MAEPYNILSHYRVHTLASWPRGDRNPQFWALVMFSNHHPFIRNSGNLVVEGMQLLQRGSIGKHGLDQESSVRAGLTKPLHNMHEQGDRGLGTPLISMVIHIQLFGLKFG